MGEETLGINLPDWVFFFVLCTLQSIISTVHFFKDMFISAVVCNTFQKQHISCLTAAVFCIKRRKQRWWETNRWESFQSATHQRTTNCTTTRTPWQQSHVAPSIVLMVVPTLNTLLHITYIHTQGMYDHTHIQYTIYSRDALDRHN